MAKSFSSEQWSSIEDKLKRDPEKYGFPYRGRHSLVFSSFNIRKFGSLYRSEGSWDFLVNYIRQCDFIAIQEAMDDMSSLFELIRRLGRRYQFVVSDIAGGVPGERGNKERLVFVYRNDRVRPTGLASDISFERSEILEVLHQYREQFSDSFDTYTADIEEWEQKNELRKQEGKGKLSKPTLVLPRFLQFIRTPHITSFETVSGWGAEPYQFLAVNAHLLYGNKYRQREERYMEFKALMDWLLTRAQEMDRLKEPNLFLFGDLNLDLEEFDRRKAAIEKFIKSLNQGRLKDSAKLNMPFIDAHPSMKGEPFRTNARKNQTYDHIGIIAQDERLPPPFMNRRAGEQRDRYDFGMFDFVSLFHDSTGCVKCDPEEIDYSLFEHDVSDHMPIWVRLQIPHRNQDTFAWR